MKSYNHTKTGAMNRIFTYKTFVKNKSSIRSFRKQSLIYVVFLFVLLPMLAYPMGGASCIDGILNQDETSIDCGGVCSAIKCSNGIQDCTETGIDCGGDCGLCPCPRCSNGIQDCNETGVDCGGPDCSTCGGPSLVWERSMGGTNDDRGYSIALDGSDNVYTTGRFVGTVDFDPGAGIANLTAAGNSDIFIQKLDAAGNYLWAKRMGSASAGSDFGRSIAADASGNVYTIGWFLGTVDFDPGAGTANLTSAGVADVFIQKLDASGNYVWAVRMGSGSSEYGASIAVDGFGNVYTMGYFSFTVDFDPGAGVANLSSAGDYDAFLQKLDASGNFVWAKRIGGGSTDYGRSIVVDASGNVYSTGYFASTVDFDPGAGTANLTSAGNWDIFVQKLDASGNYLWAKQMGGTDADYGRSIALDAAGNVYITGQFRGTADFDPGAGTANLTSAGNWDIYISKLDASGAYLCATRMGGPLVDYANSIAVNASGNIFITGDQYSTIVDYDPGAGVFELSNAGSEATFVAQYDGSCNFMCSFILTPGHNETFYNRHLAVDGASNLYITSSFNSPVIDFDPCPAVFNAPMFGGYDIYVAKYDFSNCSCSVLPVELLSFSGKQAGARTQLQWATTSEINNDYFTIERSINGNEFYPIGQVEGAGYSYSRLNYSFEDKNPLAENYYRLKQVDFNGELRYSKTISINVESNLKYEVYQIYDLYGREIKDIGNLSQGIYITKDAHGYRKIYISAQ